MPARADGDRRFVCENSVPRLFTLTWPANHLKPIGNIARAVIHGGLFAMGVARGSGKTTLHPASPSS